MGIAAALCLLYFKLSGRSEQNSLTITQSWQIGRDLVANTNSARLTSLQPGVQKQLAEFLGSPARVEAVLLGDEPRSAEDLKATTRIYLVNERNERLGLRLQKEPEPAKFRILGFWIPSSVPQSE
jgi:hypothetical protein